VAQSYYDVNKLKQYIAANAPKYGLDPATALKVWTGEGLKEGIWQSNIYSDGQRERSYGPFQFYIDGGMGNVFQKATGLDPRDPKNVYAMADWSMAHAGKSGWGEWYAARDQKIGPWQGITKGVSQGPMAILDQIKSGGGGGDDPNIMPQNIGAFQLPHLPNYDPVPGTFDIQTAAGPAPASDPNAAGGGILSKLFGSFGTRPKPYYLPNASNAYMAQNLQDKGWPSLRSFLG